jgi:penicillin amidase
VRRAIRFAGALCAALALVVAFYAGNVIAGMHATAQLDGTIAGTGVNEPVHILRDGRGIPHIRASNEHDLFFAEGYVAGQDRLFQLDLLRRYVYGELSEVLGSATLDTDEAARIVPVRALVAAQWRRFDARQQALLQAFADGVNAARARESVPVEFRILGYTAAPWRPQDSLAVGFATVLDLTDSWNDIANRVANPAPLSDPCYDAPVMDGLARMADPAHCTRTQAKAALLRALLDKRPPVGSNEWAAGAAHTTTGRALLANDPHLRLQIPGVWYLVDLQAPGFHAAGATLAGTPGVILGHNDRVAWGATNGTVASLSVFDAPAVLAPSEWRTETFHTRFGHDLAVRYYRGVREFGTFVTVRGISRFVLVRWNAYDDPQSPILAFDGLDRARTIEDALAALRRYPGPTQNFALADTSGRVAYHLAGTVPNDPLWARNIHPAADLAHTYPAIPFDRLPRVDASRAAIVWTSNNKMYGPSYPLRLSAAFAPPYRAFRVAQLLRARSAYDVAYFASMQMDTLSVAEHELASYAPTLAAWDGRFTPGSRDATAAFEIRNALVQREGWLVAGMIDARTQRAPAAALAVDPVITPQPWGSAGAVTVKHPLAALGLSFLNGTTFAGNGDGYTVHVQNDGFSQSFRAVWDVGNWDAGGITIPQGESGRPGSPYYTDEAADWIAGRLPPLPFSNAAVDRATVNRLTLTP